MRCPVRGALLSTAEVDPKKPRFLIPFADFFQNDSKLHRAVLRPDEELIYAPMRGILTHADRGGARFLICGHIRTALWLHTADNRPLALSAEELLLLCTEGSPLKEGQVLCRIDLAALRRRGCKPLLSLLCALPFRCN